MANNGNYEESRYIKERNSQSLLSDGSSLGIHSTGFNIDSDQRSDVRSNRDYSYITQIWQQPCMRHYRDVHIPHRKDSLIQYPPVNLFNNVNRPFSASTNFKLFPVSTNSKPFSVSTTSGSFSASTSKCFDQLTELSIDKGNLTVGIGQQLFALERFFSNQSVLPYHQSNRNISYNDKMDIDKQYPSTSLQRQISYNNQPENYQVSVRQHLSRFTERPFQISKEIDKRCNKEEYQGYGRQNLSRVTKRSSEISKEFDEQNYLKKIRLQNDHWNVSRVSECSFQVPTKLDQQNSFKKDEYQTYQDFIQEHLSKVAKSYSTKREFEPVSLSKSLNYRQSEQPETYRVPDSNYFQVPEQQLPLSILQNEKLKKHQEYIRDEKLLQQPQSLSKTQRRKLRKRQRSLEKTYGFQPSISTDYQRFFGEKICRENSCKKNQLDKYCTSEQTSHQQSTVTNSSASVQDLQVISNEPLTKLSENKSQDKFSAIVINLDDKQQLEVVSSQTSTTTEPEIIEILSDEEDGSKVTITPQTVNDDSLTSEELKKLRNKKRKELKKAKWAHYKKFGCFPPVEEVNKEVPVKNTDEVSLTTIISDKAKEIDSKIDFKMTVMTNNFPAEKFTVEETGVIEKQNIDDGVQDLGVISKYPDGVQDLEVMPNQSLTELAGNENQKFSSDGVQDLKVMSNQPLTELSENENQNKFSSDDVQDLEVMSNQPLTELSENENQNKFSEVVINSAEQQLEGDSNHSSSVTSENEIIEVLSDEEDVSLTPQPVKDNSLIKKKRMSGAQKRAKFRLLKGSKKGNNAVPVKMHPKMISEKAEENNSKTNFEMAIMKHNFPAEEFTEEETHVIKKRIIEEVNTSESQPLPKIEQTKYSFGVLLICCNNNETAEWLKNTFNDNPTVLPDCTLKVTLASEMPRVSRISLKTDDTITTDPVLFLKRIDQLNPDYKATKWRFKKRWENYVQNQHVSTSWSFEIDYDMLNVIKEKEQFVYTGLNKSKISIVKPPKSYSKMFSKRKEK